MYINKALIYGNLTRDPDVRALPSGRSVVSFSIATNRVFTDRDGKKQEQTDFHNIVAFGRTAESAGQYLKKGSTAFVEGHIQTRSWEKDGEKKYRTEIVAERIQFGPRRQSDPFDQPGEPDVLPEAKDEDGVPEAVSPADDINPDDIPF